ncbi:hypothetical protein [Bradyrhizobium cenepequi]|uniref:hypothetical protein n=1 Tax=Bradyrhizobium cenepequi TaxID=2821403 RepID=UPI001CE305D3|nr:hypothetical protein [Bradyrhizobium cenepequi]MCA6109918.1 hypothetical protein [Bradyrhizobium cenepequi]
MLWSRYQPSRLAWLRFLEGEPPDQVESGIAIVTLIDSIVSVITTHGDNAPVVTEVAVALASRDGTAGAVRLSKPAVPGDHVMVQILACVGESPRSLAGGFAIVAGNIAAVTMRKMAKPRHRERFCP